MAGQPPLIKRIKDGTLTIVEGLIKCNNPNCITNKPREPITAKFHVISKENLLLRCVYCGRYVESQDVMKQVKAQKLYP